MKDGTRVRHGRVALISGLSVAAGVVPAASRVYTAPPAVPPVAPAVANAVFAASGRRVRRLPMRTEHLPGAS